jgi:hypothetical protein
MITLADVVGKTIGWLRVSLHQLSEERKKINPGGNQSYFLYGFVQVLISLVKGRT